MALEQTVKDLQAQNAHFQQMFMALTQGQEELKSLVIKEKKKKAKKAVGILNIRRRHRGPIKQPLYLTTPLNEGDNHEEVNNPEADEEEVDYSEE